MPWAILLHDAFELELLRLPEDLQDELLAHAKLLEQFGLQLGRPTVDTLKGARHVNMKELRVPWNGQVWRVPLRSTPRAKPFCWWVARNRGPTSAGFISA